MSRYTRKHPDIFERVKHLLGPIQKIIAGKTLYFSSSLGLFILISTTDILRKQFPAIWGLYCEVWELMKLKHPDVTPGMFPFASFAVNIAGEEQVVITLGHIDLANFGVCLVIPFGDFDPEAGARVVLEELGIEVEVAPGVPLIFPSALYYHYNTALEKAGFRNSFVAWMGGSLVQWYKLGGMAFADLCAECQKKYRSKAGRADRKKLWMDMFPAQSSN